MENDSVKPFFVPENELFKLSELNNRYFVVRHGESEANIQKLVVSDPNVGVANYGLTGKGRDQITDSSRKFLRLLRKRMLELSSVIGEEAAGKLLFMNEISDQNSIVVSSDFKRAMETAEILTRELGLQSVERSKDLRERFFGEYDMRQGDCYAEVWGRDSRNYAQKLFDVESVAEVLKRLTRLVRKIEASQKGKNIFLVCHGDVGQIMETGFRKMNPGAHRSLQHLENAEIREMWLNPLVKVA